MPKQNPLIDFIDRSNNQTITTTSAHRDVESANEWLRGIGEFGRHYAAYSTRATPEQASALRQAIADLRAG